MAEFNTTGLEDVIEAFSRREQATVEAVPKMLKAGADVLVEAQKSILTFSRRAGRNMETTERATEETCAMRLSDLWQSTGRAASSHARI